MGAQLEDKPCLPLTIRRSSLQGISYQAEVASAQVKSAVLLAGLAAAGTTTYLEPTQTRDHTERMLLDFGVKVVKQQSNEGQALSVSASSLKAASIRIPGDISSAAFWMVAACLLPGSRIVLPEVGINPTRTGVLKALSRMGASIALSKHSNTAEPTATLTVNYAPLNATVISGSEIPLLIDELPVLGVAAAFAEGTTEIRDAAELRVKESDRIRTLAQGLVACGVEVEELADGLKITGNPGLKPCFPEISSHGDHRIAMAFSIATLRLGGHISDTACIQTSYPSFFKHLSEVRGRP
jgi:3-phosphoshikimate 1-carboxyvinyltransferase